MAKGTSFNFGANARKPRAKKPKKAGGKGRGHSSGSGNSSNAWRAYVGVSNAPISE